MPDDSKNSDSIQNSKKNDDLLNGVKRYLQIEHQNDDKELREYLRNDDKELREYLRKQSGLHRE
jgi:hypothetical protein